MDERLLKQSVESIEMPGDMKDRIIENCRSGETSPLIVPKKRFVYMPMAVTACVCILVAALAGVGVWRMSRLSDDPPVTLSSTTITDAANGNTGTSVSGEPLTIYKLLEICSGDTSKLSWRDFERFECTEIGSGLMVRQYVIEGGYTLTIGGEDFYSEPEYMYFLISWLDQGIDIREDSLEDYIASNPAKERLTLEKLREICSGDPSTLSWSDFEQFECREIGSGLYILEYSIEGAYTLLIGGVPEDEPVYMIFFALMAEEQGIDIREGGLEDYLALHSEIGTTVTHIPLTLEKLKEICSGDTSKLSWSDFEQFESTAFGSGLAFLQYDIEGKYTLTIGGSPDTEPLIMFYVSGQYYAIDIRKDSIEDYLNEPIPEGDFINVIPITWEDIDGGAFSAEFIAGDQVPLTDKQLTEYFGIDITSFGGIPSDMEQYAYRGTPSMTARHIWADDRGSVYYDQNPFSFGTLDHSRTITITVSTLPNSIDKLGKNQKMWSRIGGRIVRIGQTEDGHYEVELPSADSVLGIGISADGISLEELCGVISALVEKTEVRNFVNEDYPYPWEYIQLIVNS